MRFEWDAEKASINQKKHGVPFEEAQTVFGDYDALRIFDRRRSLYSFGIKYSFTYSCGLSLLQRR